MNWNYFKDDPNYSQILRERLKDSIEMDSAKAISEYLNHICDGDLKIVDFGGGPGHYYPVIKKLYARGKLQYKSVDIDAENISFGKSYFLEDDNVKFELGSVLEPDSFLGDCNTVITANTLPHIPSIFPLLNAIRKNKSIKFFIARMLVGKECVQIKKHLFRDSFDTMFESGYQLNNIYSMDYIAKHLDVDWTLREAPDIFDNERLANHKITGLDNNNFYNNRVSRPLNGLIFKGEIYMPWKFVLGTRI